MAMEKLRVMKLCQNLMQCLNAAEKTLLKKKGRLGIAERKDYDLRNMLRF